MTDRLQRMFREFRRTVSRTTDQDEGRPDPTPTGESEELGQTDGGMASRPERLDYDPDAIEHRIDTMTELGLAPGTFVTRLLEENGGRLKQQSLTEYTAWSESTTSRLLTELEEKGTVVRVQIGREKIVRLAEE